MEGNRLFTPLRALGIVTSAVPFALQARGSDHFATTAVGDAYHVYNTEKLNLVFVGNPGKAIDALAVHGDLTFTACGSDVFAWKRGRKIRTFAGHSSPVKLLLPFGDHLVTVGEDSLVLVFDVSSASITSRLEDLASMGISVTAILHPATYLNKILIGSADGRLQLWNIRTNQLIYTFKGWGSPVTSLAAAPALDIVAVGLQSGRIAVHNLKLDQTVMTLTQDGPVTALSFRTDGEPFLASGFSTGQIAVWNLEERHLQTVIAAAHSGAVTALEYLASHPQLLSAGTDNAIKLWIFDQADGSARILRQRAGHGAPPTRVRYHGTDGITLLTAGQDCAVRVASTVSDEFAVELSQGSIAKKSKSLGVRVEDLKLPPALDLASEITREEDWDNIVTCHQGHGVARTWSYKNKTIGKHKLGEDDASLGEIRSVALSACGNFAFLGTAAGRLRRYNIQSGLLRGEYGSPAHKGAIRGIASDAVGAFVISAARDKTVRFWHAKTQRPVAAIDLGSAAESIALHRDSALLAVACSDYRVEVIDTDAHRTVRIFTEHSGRITDMAWSSDARWLLTSSMDGCVRTWDIPTGRLLSAFRVAQAVTSMALSPSGDTLATTHVDSLGIMLWTNRSLYMAVDLRPLPPSFDPLDLPLATAATDAVSAAQVDLLDQLPTFASPAQMDACITLSDLPRARWAVLPDLATIRERNKPLQPPKAPSQAPFFLPSLTGSAPSGPAPEDDGVKRKSRVGVLGSLHSAFASAVAKGGASGQYDAITAMMREMSASATDLEIRSLSPLITDRQLEGFVSYLAHMLKTGRNYELTQAYLAVFLNAHADAVASQPGLAAAVRALAEVQAAAWSRLQGLVQQTDCLVSFLSGTM